MRFDVVTFGSAVVDVFVHTDVAERRGFMEYKVGEKILIKDLKFDIGGGGTNTGVAFARLGFKTGYLGKLGKDDNGKRILRLLRREGVKFIGRKEKSENSEKTGYSVILDSKGGDRTILTYKGANDDLDFEEIKLRKVKKTKWLYYSALLGKSFESQKKLAEFLVPRGVKLAFNPSSYIINNLDISKLLKLTEILILNKEEAESLCKSHKKDSKKYLESLHSLGPRIVVVTNKDKKIEAYDGAKKYTLVPHRNIKVVERTGAGDAFASGFVAGQMAGKSIEESLKLGLEESESVIRYFGAKNRLLRMNLK